MFRRALLVFLGLILVVTLAPAAGAADPPRPITVPGGLTPTGRTLAGSAAVIGDCEQDNVSCRPTRSTSCTGYTSQANPPTTIRVLTGDDAASIKTVPFQEYVQNVLPNEWVPTWDGDALKAGAIAVKSYAW